jgi:hypothetical protein
MGMIVPFRHGRTSIDSPETGGRAAKSASKSAVTPPSCAVDVARIALHHSDGMLLRWSHLRAFAAGAPMSEAIAPGDRQRAITERKDVRAGAIRPFIGQSVLKRKAELSHDLGHQLLDNCSMAERMSETEEKLAFIRRTRMAREARFKNQGPICTILDLDQGTYKQYETRTPLPHRYIPKFIAATGVSYEWLLADEGKGPEMPEYPREIPKRTSTAKKRNAA